MAKAVVDMKEIAPRITLVIRRSKEFKWRVTVATWFIRFGVWLMWMNVEFTDDGDLPECCRDECLKKEGSVEEV